VQTLSRMRFSKLMVFILCFVLAFGSLLKTSTTYAATDEWPAPENLHVVDKTSTTVSLAWDPVEGAEDYNVYYGNGVYAGWAGTNSKIIDKLEPNTEYTFKVAVKVQPQSNPVTVTTLAASDNDPKPVPTLSAPTNLRIAKDPETGEDLLSATSVTLEWDFLKDQNGEPISNDIDIWNSDGSNVTWGNYWTRTLKLEPETTYKLYITWHVHRPSHEFKSNIIEFTTPEDLTKYPDPPLTPPSYLKVQDITDSYISLGWTGSPGATGYVLYMNGDLIDGTIDNSVITYTYTPNKGMEIGKTYIFEVRAKHAVEGQLKPDSANSNAVTITWGELAAPEDLQIVTANRTTATFGWAPTPGATSYDIYKDNTLAGSSNSNRYVATGLSEGQSYSFKVVAKNSLWTSPESNEVTVVPGSNYNIVTYYTAWSVYDRNFKPSDIDVSQITHINYAFSDLCWRGNGTGATACQDTNIPLQKDYVFDGEMVIGDHEVDLANFAELAKIRDNNPHLSLMISVGGWSWSKNFSNMASTEVTRRAFANSVVDFLREYRLDGLDVDWEYPVEGGEGYNSRRPEDKQNFTLLMQTVREALDAAGSEDGRYYLLSIASGQGDNFVVNADLANSSQYLDYINIMTYDYSGSWDVNAYHNAPLLYDKNNPDSNAPRFNVNGGVTGHLNGGVPNYKLTLGLPFYGKGWIGCPPDGQYQLCAGGSIPNFGTWESRTFDFSDIEDHYVNENGYVRYWNEAAKVPYLYNSEKQAYISYNDEISMMYSASYVKSLDLAGVMSWEISGDRNMTLSTQLVHDLPIDGTVNASTLVAPSNLAVSSKNENSIQLKWEASAGATGYEVFVNKQWIGFTKETQYTVDSLTPDTQYKINVIAIEKVEDQIKKVSPASNELNVTTLAYNVTQPSFGGWIPPSKATDQLDAIITKDGNRTIVKVRKDGAAETIKNATSTKFRVVVDGEAKKTEVTIPQEIIAAIAAKGDQAVLAIIINNVEYSIPIHALPQASEIRITIESPEQEVIDSITKLSQSKNLKVVVLPLEFRIDKINSDQTSEEITEFNNLYLSRIFTLDDATIDINRSTGVIYIPGTNEFRSVPTRFTLNSDGTVTAELKRKGNSIYAIVETNFNFKDVTKGWAEEDVTKASAKLIATGVGPEQFGVNRNITRAEIVSMIVKALGIIPDAADSSFRDVDNQSEYAKDIEAARKMGLIKGKTEDAFDPNGSVTRQEMAVMLANAMKYTGKGNDAKPAVLTGFEDQAAISSYARASLALMVEQQIMVGVSKTQMAPRSNVTKAQATVAVMRMLRAAGLSN